MNFLKEIVLLFDFYSKRWTERQNRHKRLVRSLPDSPGHAFRCLSRNARSTRAHGLTSTGSGCAAWSLPTWRSVSCSFRPKSFSSSEVPDIMTTYEQGFVDEGKYMDLTDLQAALPEEQEPEQRDERSDYRDVRNLVSDENGRNESVGERSASSGNLSEATEEFMESLDEEAAAVRGRMQASREAFERGRREEREMIARHKAQREAKDGEKPSGVKQKGRVLVSYSLPGRTDVYLHTPAYQCEGGGEVTVAITVNRNGKVTAASLKETTTSSNCINETAVTAARNSRFNVDGSAADRQSGTITYIFVPQ